jgi:hypothetical protein
VVAVRGDDYQLIGGPTEGLDDDLAERDVVVADIDQLAGPAERLEQRDRQPSPGRVVRPEDVGACRERWEPIGNTSEERVGGSPRPGRALQAAPQERQAAAGRLASAPLPRFLGDCLAQLARRALSLRQIRTWASCRCPRAASIPASLVR